MLNSTSDILNKLNITKTLYQKFDQDRDAEKALSRTLIREALDEVYHRGDMAMLGFVGLHFILAVFFGFYHSTWGLTWLVSFGALVIFYASVLLYPKTLFTRILAGIVLQAFVLLYIYQLNGLPEIRFFFFTSFTILIVYQDWRAMWPSVFLFFGQMFMFTYLNSFISATQLINQEYENFILRLVPRQLNSMEIDWLGLGFYIGISCLQVGLAGLWAHFLRRQTIREVLTQQTLLTKQMEIEQTNSRLEEIVSTKTQDLQEALEHTRANEEELRQNMEELQTTQEEIDNQRRQLLDNQTVMQKVEKELRERQTEMERQQWLESNLSRFDDVMRLNYDKNLAEFSDIIMLHLAELLKATQGAFYVYDELENALEMTGGYACTPKTVKKNKFTVGEGVLGQIIKTKRMVLLDDLPDDRAVIESALTKVSSKSLVIVPLMYNTDIQGVIEIAVLQKISDLHLEFIQRLAKNVATMLQSIRGILRTQHLLEQSQEMTARLRENAKELEHTKQEFEQQALDFQRQFTAIDHSMLVLEFSPEGDILRLNDNFLNLSKYTAEELIGKHQSIFLAESYVNSNEYRQLWNRLRNSELVEAEYECVAKDGTAFWMRANYYTVGEGKSRRISILAYDITTEKAQDKKILEQLQALQENDEIMQQNLEIMRSLQEENEKRARELQEQLNAINISTAMVEYDGVGNIKFVNDKFLELLGYTKDELLGKSHKILLKKRYADSTAYQKFWERLKNNEFIDGEFDFIRKDGSIIWLRGSYYPVSDHRGRLVKVMQLATNISHEMQQEEKIKEYLLDLEVAKTKFKDTAIELQAQLEALERTTPIIELSPDGEILKTTPQFLTMLKYNSEDLQNKHHRLLVTKNVQESVNYKLFWEKLNRSEVIEGEFVQTSKNTPLPINYYPITDSGEKVTKIVGIINRQSEYANGSKITKMTEN
jgi:PAS domain S-box-containing protein